MSIVLTRGSRWLFALALVLSTSLFAASAPIEEKPEPRGPETPADKLRKELEKPVTIEIAEQPLNLAMNQLREQSKVQIVVDQFALNQMGLSPEQMSVTVNAKDQKLKTVLRGMLGQHNLSFAVIGDSVIVSTDEMCMHRQLRQRVTVDFEKVELGTALKKMARQTGTNVVFDPKVGKEVTTPITMQLDQEMPYELAVKLMVEMAGLKAVRVGNVLFICTKEKATEMRQDPDFAPNPNGPVPGIDFPPGIPRGFGGQAGGIQILPGGAVPPNAIPADPAVPVPAQPPGNTPPPPPDR